MNINLRQFNKLVYCFDKLIKPKNRIHLMAYKHNFVYENYVYYSFQLKELRISFKNKNYPAIRDILINDVNKKAHLYLYNQLYYIIRKDIKRRKPR